MDNSCSNIISKFHLHWYYKLSTSNKLFHPLLVWDRPVQSSDRSNNINLEVIKDRQELRLHFSDKSSKIYTFDRIFAPEVNQLNVYKSMVMPMVEEVLEGYNCTIFASVINRSSSYCSCILSNYSNVCKPFVKTNMYSYRVAETWIDLLLNSIKTKSLIYIFLDMVKQVQARHILWLDSVIINRIYHGKM